MHRTATLEFYPGSHRLPYIFSHDLHISVDDMRNDGYSSYRARYEPLVQQMISERDSSRNILRLARAMSSYGTPICSTVAHTGAIFV